MREHARSLTYVIAAIDITRQLPVSTIIHAFSEWLSEELPDDESDDPIPWRVYLGMMMTVSICTALAWRGLFREANETVTDMQVKEDAKRAQEPRAIVPPPPVEGDLLPDIYVDGIRAASFFFRAVRWISGMVSVADNVKAVVSVPAKNSPWWGWASGLPAGLYTSYRSAAPTISYPSHNADHPINNPAYVLSPEQFSQARRAYAWRALYQLARFGLPLATVQAHITSILPLIPSLLQGIGIHGPFEPFMPAISFGSGIGFYFIWRAIEDQFLLPNLNAHFRRNPAGLKFDWRAAGVAAGFSMATFFWYFRFFSDFQFRHPEKEIIAAIPPIIAIPGLYYRYARVEALWNNPLEYQLLENPDQDDRDALDRLAREPHDREAIRNRAAAAPYHQRLVMVERGRIIPVHQPAANGGEQPAAAAANEEAKQQLPAANPPQRIEIVIEDGDREIKNSDVTHRRGVSRSNALTGSPLRDNSFLNERQRAGTAEMAREQEDSVNDALPTQYNIKVQ